MTEFEKMIRLLDTSWCMRGQIVPCLVGPPGIGKTAAVMQHAEAHGCGKVVKIVASRCVPSETVGMTMPDHAHRSMAIYNSMQLSSLEDGDILFLDELLEADQFVLSTLLTVIESREMADGTPLPDIQIVAATNDTIPPEQLKGNIRQRFMFQRFYLDKEQTGKYIEELTGIKVPADLLSRLKDTGNDYNFLTPRSLTKLFLWIDAVPEDMIDDTATVINDIWRSSIGSEIASARRKRDHKIASPEEQLREAVKSFYGTSSHSPFSDGDIGDCTMAELLDKLQALPEWDVVKDYLMSIQVEEPDDDVKDIAF